MAEARNDAYSMAFRRRMEKNALKKIKMKMLEKKYK